MSLPDLTELTEPDRDPLPDELEPREAVTCESCGTKLDSLAQFGDLCPMCAEAGPATRCQI